MRISNNDCENCGAAIGNLETPFIFGEHVVCAACYRRLAEAARPPNPIEQHSPSARLCPLCQQPAVKVRGLQGSGEVLTFLALFLPFMLPAIAYYVYMEGVPYCTSCAIRVSRRLSGEHVTLLQRRLKAARNTRAVLVLITSLLMLLFLVLTGFDWSTRPDMTGWSEGDIQRATDTTLSAATMVVAAVTVLALLCTGIVHLRVRRLSHSA